MNLKTLSNENVIYVDIDNVIQDNYLQRNTAYDKYDCVQAYDLMSWLYLECIKAGTTTLDYTDLYEYDEDDIIQDGTAEFVVRYIGKQY